MQRWQQFIPGTTQLSCTGLAQLIKLDARNDWWMVTEARDILKNLLASAGGVLAWEVPSWSTTMVDLHHLILDAHTEWVSSGSGGARSTWCFPVYHGPPAPTIHIWGLSFLLGEHHIMDFSTGAVYDYLDPVANGKQVLGQWLTAGDSGFFIIDVPGNATSLAAMTYAGPCAKPISYTEWASIYGP